MSMVTWEDMKKCQRCKKGRTRAMEQKSPQNIFLRLEPEVG